MRRFKPGQRVVALEGTNPYKSAEFGYTFNFKKGEIVQIAGYSNDCCCPSRSDHVFIVGEKGTYNKGVECVFCKSNLQGVRCCYKESEFAPIEESKTSFTIDCELPAPSPSEGIEPIGVPARKTELIP